MRETGDEENWRVGGLSACGPNREMLCKRGVRKRGTRIQTCGVRLVFFFFFFFFFFFSPRSGSWRIFEGLGNGLGGSLGYRPAG